MSNDALRNIRKERGVSSVAMCNHLGISRPTYAKYEKNPGLMTVDQATAVCEFLHCRLGDIFFAYKG